MITRESLTACIRDGCDVTFAPITRGGQAKRYCSERCRKKAEWKRWAQSKSGKLLMLQASRKHARTEKGKLTKARFSATEKGRVCNSRKWHRRRALKLEAFVEDVDVRVLIEKQGGRCSLCGGSFVGSHPSLLSATVDHTVPLSRGGEHSYRNCTAAHLSCNSKKGTQ